MNAENYPDFLRQPERLWQLNGHELRSLVMEHPYSANLHLLLAKKAQMEEWPDADALLTKAATYHSDRRQLHWQIRTLPTQRPEDAPRTIEEVLELKPLDAPLPEVPELTELERTPPTASVETAFNALIVPGAGGAAAASDSWEEEALVWPTALPDEAPVTTVSVSWAERLDAAVETAKALPLTDDFTAIMATPPVSVPVQLPHWEAQWQYAVGIAVALPLAPPEMVAYRAANPAYRDVAADLVATVAAGIAAADSAWVPALAGLAAPDPEEVIAPLPVEVLPSYREQYRPARLSTLSELLENKGRIDKSKKKKAKRRKPKTKEVARRSLETDTELVSETLAQLLESQGHYERAKAMYERLSLSNPEKSGFFAARIEALQDQLDRLPPA